MNIVLICVRETFNQTLCFQAVKKLKMTQCQLEPWPFQSHFRMSLLINVVSVLLLKVNIGIFCQLALIIKQFFALIDSHLLVIVTIVLVASVLRAFKHSTV